MPMYEYGCDACQDQFTLLRQMNQDDATVSCPTCGSNRVQRHFSLFAAHSKGGDSVVAEPQDFGGGGSCCSPGVCGCSAK